MRDWRGMQGVRRRVPARLAVVLAAVALVTAAGVAYAATALTSATANDPVVVCVNNANGEMRAVRDASACRTNESAIELARATGPQSVTVDCAAGEKVNDVLAASADNPSKLTITVRGTCVEAVAVRRDDVTIRGDSAGDGFRAPAADSVPLGLRGASRIALSQLTLTGGVAALSASSGSDFEASSLTISGASHGIIVSSSSAGVVSGSSIDDSANTGISAAIDGSLSFFGGTISDSAIFGVWAQGGQVRLGGGVVVTRSGHHGVMPSGGGAVVIQGATIENSGSSGVFAWHGGSAIIRGSATLIRGNAHSGVSASQGTVEISGGARITGNRGGGVGAFNNGSIILQGGPSGVGPVIDGNDGGGLSLGTGSTAFVQNSVAIKNNRGDGVSVNDTSVVSFDRSTHDISGNTGWGVRCEGAPGVAMIAGPQPAGVSGNTAGQISCPTAGPPFATVDCAAGQTVADALARAPASGRYTISIRGTCTERVNINRDATTIEGGAPGATLAAPSPGSTVVMINGAEDIRLANIAISGGGGGITAFSRAGVTTDNVRITGFANTGILINAESNGHLNNTTIEGGDGGIGVDAVSNASINGGTISGARFFNVSASRGSAVFIGGGALITGAGFHGVHASNGASVNVGNATIQNSAGTGLFAFQGGNVSANAGSLIQGNNQGGVGANAATAVVGGGRVTDNAPFGVLAYNGGVLTIQGGAIIEANRGSGVHLNVASSLAIQDATVRNNAGSGIEVNDTGVVGGQGNTITGNGGWGVRCSGPPSVAMISTGPGGLGDLSGNGAGTENCPNA